jgi:hypothetical protein
MHSWALPNASILNELSPCPEAWQSNATKFPSQRQLHNFWRALIDIHALLNFRSLEWSLKEACEFVNGGKATFLIVTT